MLTLRVGARPSPLAVKQVEEIKRLLPDVEFMTFAIQTKGDKDKYTPLSEMEWTDFFTKEIEAALLKGQIDVAVHSAKDLEARQPKELTIAAITPSVSAHDCLVSRDGSSLKDLPAGSVVGTSSVKRKEAILRFRKDLKVKDIRGDIGERLRKLDDGEFDAVIVAHAALIRLGLEDRISQIIPEDIIEPHPLQGRLAVQVLKNRSDLIDIFEAIDERLKG